MELFFDTWDGTTLPKPDVRQYTNQIIKLMEIDPELHAPPVLRVEWASLQLRCVLARASQKFIMCDSGGQPVRARVTVTFNEYIDAEREAKDVSRQTADYSKVHVVLAGETLSSTPEALRRSDGVAPDRHRQRSRRSARDRRRP